MANCVSLSDAVKLTVAVLATTVMSAACSTDVNPVAPGGTVSAGPLIPGSPAAASHRPSDDGKVALCHRNQGASGFVAISVSPSALDAHLAHGDGRPGEAVPDQPGRLFGPDCAVSSPAPVTVGFGGLAGAGEGARFTTYTEAGFIVSVAGPSSFTRAWEVATLYGNPAPFIQFRVPPGSPQTIGAISVSAAGAPFTLLSVDLYSSVTPIPYELRGFLNGMPVFTATGTVPNTFGAFRTVSNPYAEVLVDSVTIVLTNPEMPACCGNAMGLDNIVLMSAGGAD